MSIHIKSISLLTLLVSIFFIHISVTSALTTCPGRPDATLSWSSASCTALTPGYSAGCSFSGASGSRSIANGTSCSVSFSCTGPGGSAGPSSDSINYDPSLVWNGSSCVAPAPTCPADSPYTENRQPAIDNYCGACPAGYHQPSTLSCHSGNTPGWTAFGSSCTAPYCGGCGCIADAAPAPSTGTWSYPSSCPASCGQPQTTQTQICTGGNGSCAGSASSRTCSATAACATNTNCVGSWSNNGTCSVSGACGQTGVVQQTYTITTAQSGTGSSCPSNNGDTRWGTTSCGTAACAAASGSLSAPSSCTIASGASTCTVVASWNTSGAASPNLYDANTSTTLSNAANSAGLTVWVTNPSTTFRLRDGATTLATKTVTSSCAAGSTWSAGSCIPNSCGNGANNYPTCNTCTAPQVWNSSSSVCTGPTGITVSPASYSSTLPTNTVTATYTLTNGNSGNSTCRLLDNTSSPITAYAPCGGSISVAAPTTPGTYGYYVQTFKAPTGETMASNAFTVTIAPAPVCGNGANNYPTCTTCNAGYTLISGSCTVTVPGCTAPGANDYNPSANVDDGSCCYGLNTWNGVACVPPAPQINTFSTEPRVSTLGSASTLSWDIKYPINSCTLTATTVCAGGHSSCNASELASEAALNNTFQTGNTDSNDAYGASRSILSAIRTVASPSTTNARGKKTLQITKTTDLLLNCGGVSKKVRFLSTTNSEG